MSEVIVNQARWSEVAGRPSIVAVDPGYTQSALVVYDGTRVTAHRVEDNAAILALLGEWPLATQLVVEEIESFGMPVGREVFGTVFWSGRFVQAWAGEFTLLTRRDVKLHLCGASRAKDANVRQALIDRFGPGKGTAIGVKAAPGPLYAITGDEWSALAVAVTWWDTVGSVPSANFAMRDRD